VGIPLPVILLIAAFALLLIFYFAKSTHEDGVPIASQGRITIMLMNECPMLGHFVTIRALIKRHNFDREALECVVDDLVIFGILERVRRKKGILAEVELYRLQISTSKN
jgi:hypothetical protein